MKRLTALLMAAALICAGCSDKNKDSSEESSSASSQETVSEELTQDSESSEAESSGRKASQKPKESQLSGGEPNDEPQLSEETITTEDFTEVNMNLNVLEEDQAPNLTKIPIDLSSYPGYTFYGAACSGDSLWFMGMDENDTENVFLTLFRYDIAPGSLTEIQRYDIDSTYVPGFSDIFYACGRLLCNAYSKDDDPDAPTTRVAEIDMETGEVVPLIEGKGWICTAEDGFISLITEDLGTEPEEEYDIELLSFAPDTKDTKELYSGPNYGWWTDYPGEKAYVYPKNDVDDYATSYAVETDGSSLDPELPGCYIDPEINDIYLCSVSKNSVNFVQRTEGEITKRIHTYDIRSREHLIINASNMPDMFQQAGDSMLCLDPSGFIQTIYCISPLIGTAARLEDLKIDYGNAIVRSGSGVVTVSAMHQVTSEDPVYTVYQIK
ncbi:MAG: hypothetical protein IJ071_10405 [Ruminococcus sp.]|nr:hypothetical protein [Ruminococcus sp.]